MIHLRIHSIVRQKYSFKEFIHSKIIKKYSFKEFIHSKKIQNYSFKEFIHSRKSKIIHSKKIFIQVKNRLSPRANHRIGDPYIYLWNLELFATKRLLDDQETCSGNNRKPRNYVDADMCTRAQEINLK